MSRALSATELVVMISVISVSLAVMVALVFPPCTSRIDSRRTPAGSLPSGLPLATTEVGLPMSRAAWWRRARTPASSTTAVAGPVIAGV